MVVSVLRRNSLPVGFWRNPVHLLACGFGSGAAPYAPGTAGTAAAIPLVLVLAPLPLAWYLAAVALALGAGVWVCGRTARDLGVHDHSGIVWDEFVGYLITMAAVPLSWWTVLAGFFLFRVFDVFKPWPARWIDRRVRGGVGIMFDDVAAGMYAWACLQLLVQYAPW